MCPTGNVRGPPAIDPIACAPHVCAGRSDLRPARAGRWVCPPPRPNLQDRATRRGDSLRHGCRPARPRPVRADDRVPLHLPAHHHRPRLARGGRPRRSGWRTGDEVWARVAASGQAPRHHLRRRRGDRHRHGVPVRHELGRATRRSWATSSARRWRPRASSPSSSSRPSWASTLRPRPRLARGPLVLGADGGGRAPPSPAFWIIVANSWHADARRLSSVQNGRAELTDFAAAVFNPSTLPRYLHTIAASLVCGAFVMAGVAAWYLLKGRSLDVARTGDEAGPGRGRGRRRPHVR